MQSFMIFVLWRQCDFTDQPSRWDGSRSQL